MTTLISWVRMEKFGERFLKWRKSKGVSGTLIQKRVGISAANISNFEHGRRPLSDNDLKKLASMPELEITYEQLRRWKALEKYPEMAIMTEQITPVELVPVGKVDGFYKIPCRGSVAAGGLQLIDEAQDIVFYDWFDVKEFSEDMFCLKVRGDSMWPPVPDGAILLIRPTSHFKNKGWYVAVTDDGQSTFKMLEFNKVKAELVPLNPAYEPIKLDHINLDKTFEVIEYKVSRI